MQVPDVAEAAGPNDTAEVITWQYTAVGYINNKIFFARSKQALQCMVDLVDCFNSLTRIMANASKGFVVAFNMEEGGTVTLQGVAVP